MKEVNKEILKNAANRLLFDMNDEEYQVLLDEFDVMLKQMELISKVDGIDEAEPMTFPYLLDVSYLREDIAINQLTREEGLKNAKDVYENEIKLPKVVK